jgi:hypothetical protein
MRKNAAECGFMLRVLYSVASHWPNVSGMPVPIVPSVANRQTSPAQKLQWTAIRGNLDEAASPRDGRYHPVLVQPELEDPPV